jgi:hypothetical protein
MCTSLFCLREYISHLTHVIALTKHTCCRVHTHLCSLHVASVFLHTLPNVSVLALVLPTPALPPSTKYRHAKGDRGPFLAVALRLRHHAYAARAPRPPQIVHRRHATGYLHPHVHVHAISLSECQCAGQLSPNCSRHNLCLSCTPSCCT